MRPIAPLPDIPPLDIEVINNGSKAMEFINNLGDPSQLHIEPLDELLNNLIDIRGDLVR